MTQREHPAAAAIATMIESHLRARGIKDERVLAAMTRVPRERFVRAHDAGIAYGDFPLAIDEGQTISQPYIVAFMTEALRLAPDARVLEIGTGSGYQTAVLAALAGEVFSIELRPGLAARAEAVLGSLGYTNLHLRIGDGHAGWPEHAPFDAVIVTAAPAHLPSTFADQLAIGGRLVVPVGTDVQDLLVLTRTESGLREETRLSVRFVPLVRP